MLHIIKNIMNYVIYHEKYDMINNKIYDKWWYVLQQVIYNPINNAI